MGSKNITIYHSPDADDAFMFYGLTSGAVHVEGYEFSHELCDIETLNQRVRKGELDCTAASVHVLAYINKDYAVLDAGASMGEKDYGPRLVSGKPLTLTSGNKYKIALPGEFTSAALATRIYLAEKKIEADISYIYFDEIQHAVKNGDFDCGVIIHEGQLTYDKEGLFLALDLGAWWWEKHQLPLPLGVNIAKKSLGMEAMKAATLALKQSILYSLENRQKALDYALSYGRGISNKDADVFVGMYVNDRTISLGDEGKRSITQFLKEGAEYGIISEVPSIEFINP